MPLVFRVGITGSRRLTSTAALALRGSLAAVLEFLRGEIAGLATTSEAASVYELGPDGVVQPEFAMLSPLAAGSDRLAAEVALGLGYRLATVLPFAQAEYEKDFPDTLDAFRALAARGRGVVLDGARGDNETSSYEAAGRYVVRNCDLLIAIWDGNRARGRGGTAEIVEFAVGAGVPVWWLSDTGEGEPRLIETQQHFRDRDLAARGAGATEALARTISRTLLPPPAADPHRRGVLGRSVHHCCRIFRHHPTPLRDYLRETAPRRSRLWSIYGHFMRALAPRRDSARSGAPDDAEPIDPWWSGYFAPADALSLAYANRYRSSYVLIFAFGFIALIGAVLTLSAHRLAVFAIVLELIALSAITALVTANELMRWHERWISYRLLAELCRNQHMLTRLGWSLPRWEIESMATEGEIAEGVAAGPREAWVAWYFTAVTRAAPLPEGAFDPATLESTRRVGRGVLDEQIMFHRARHAQSDMASRKLGIIAELCFFLTLFIVVAKLAWLGLGGTHALADTVAWPVAILPAASAAFIGIRAYAEFEVLAQQSVRMQRVMEASKSEVEAIDLARPLASQQLAATLYNVAMSMMQDIRAWSQLFRMKIVEPG